MAVNCAAVLGSDVSQLTSGYFWSNSKPLIRVRNLAGARGVLSFGVVRSELERFIDKTVSNDSKNLQKDFSSFPS